MENIKTHKKSKKSKKPIYILSGFLLFFILFIVLITRPSLQNQAIDQVQICSNVADVKSIYEKYKFDLLESDENGNKIVSKEFQDAIRHKLDSFHLSDEEIQNCIAWLPPSNKSLNIIVIPDLSRRLIDSYNNPNQIEKDIFVLQSIWNSFQNFSKLRQDVKDKLIIDVTDIDQAKGQFEMIANQLQFDLSLHTGKSNRLFFTDERTKQFQNSISKMYESAKQKPLGADYPFYFRRYLADHLKKNTLFDNFENKVIIITDGYLEAETRQADTKFTPELYKSVLVGNTKETITSLGLNIPRIRIDLSNTDILVCEVNERKVGKTKDFEILKAYWEDWLTGMKAHKVSFIQHEQASNITKSKINDFITQ